MPSSDVVTPPQIIRILNNLFREMTVSGLLHEIDFNYIADDVNSVQHRRFLCKYKGEDRRFYAFTSLPVSFIYHAEYKGYFVNISGHLHLLWLANLTVGRLQYEHESQTDKIRNGYESE